MIRDTPDQSDHLPRPPVATLTPATQLATVRERAYEVMRDLGLTTIFSNPGSTEISLLAGLPDDFNFILSLHEGSVVGTAAGFAIARGAPALALVHTVAGLGNAVSAIANCAAARVPVVVLVGQQDRRHLIQEPFLTGRLTGLAGDYPVAVFEPPRPQDVPGLIAQAYHAAEGRSGPALLIVPQDDWLHPAPESHELAAPRRLLRITAAPAGPAVDAIVAVLDAARAPALIVGSGAADPGAWSALVALAERLQCPVWNEPFGARPGFPQEHPQFVGFLSPDRHRLRQLLAPHDALLVVGAPFLRQYGYSAGPLVASDTTVVVVTANPEEAWRSPVELAIVGDVAGITLAVTERTPARDAPQLPPREALPVPESVAPTASLRAAHVFQALAEQLPADVVLLEETPSTRHELNVRLPARTPLAHLTAAMGGLGFAMPAAIGLRLALPARPVVAIIGDGSSLYSIQALWSAARYGAGVLFVILSNGGYRVMDRIAEANRGKAVWPSFGEIDIAGLAMAQGCEARRISTGAELVDSLNEIVPTLAVRKRPILLDIEVSADPDFYMP